jgi:hypothetical protein
MLLPQHRRLPLSRTTHIVSWPSAIRLAASRPSPAGEDAGSAAAGGEAPASMAATSARAMTIRRIRDRTALCGTSPAICLLGLHNCWNGRARLGPALIAHAPPPCARRGSSVRGVTSMHEKIEDLRARRETAYHAGSERAVERQHAKGKMLARERIEYLLDDGSFHELDLLARHRAHGRGPRRAAVHRRCDHRVGHGRRPQGVRVQPGLHGVRRRARRGVRREDPQADGPRLKTGAPLVGLNDGAGARIQEGVVSLASYGGIFPQRAVVGGDPADLGDPRSVRRRRRVQPGDDRLHLHGARVVAHVHHRPRRREDRDR